MDDRRRRLIQGLNFLRKKALSFATFLFALEKKSRFKYKIRIIQQSLDLKIFFAEFFSQPACHAT